ncbi:DUF1178 family protein [Sandaracinobacter sp. RS1-74]|uniref:DUF1178 family protein n=1 Tax=Sandaracinobacteroides sayramensis TaxID=2913411 RepID=UPI001EDC12CB|nr:DUF1178 family protein [Sandaracinobacteroides sayramensis]MCG2841805.1 DUF1178 family protein [Sandaracinobacteroides sayramensis]
MIVFDLKCDAGHVFEAWFGSTGDFEGQQARGLVECPMCGSREVAKAVMAPAVSPKANRVVTDAERKTELARLAKLRAEVEANCDYVGRSFVREARARHGRTEEDGEAARGIFGEATIADAMELIDEGIPVSPLPFRPRQTADA